MEVEDIIYNPKKHSNTDEFRTEALQFMEKGFYCKHPADSISGRRYWEEQAKRCLEGYHIGRDYIPGYFYYYLNFSPILLARTNEELDDSNVMVQGERVEDFPDFWDGDYEYFHYINEAEKSGNHAVTLKTRGRGFSFKGSSMLCRNYFLIRNSKSFAVAARENFLLGDGLITKAWSNMDFIDQNTAWAKRRQYYNQAMHRRASYKAYINGVDTEKGFKSEIIGITIGDDYNKIRGIRGKLIIWEEAGANKNLLKGWNVALTSLSQGRVTYGLQCAMGTGGSEGSDFMGLNELFNNPEGYRIHAVTNKWDINANGKKSGFFMPEYMNRAGCMDKDGNSNIEKAIKQIVAERQHKAKMTSSNEALTRFIAEQPITPKEAMMRITGTIFPINDLMQRLSHIEAEEDKYRSAEWTGDLIVVGDQIQYSPTKDKPIYDFPMNNLSDSRGAVIIYEMPKRDEQGNIPYGRYISGIDTYDDDQSSTDSLGSIFVFDMWTDMIVAEYTGRPNTAEIFYEKCRRMIKFYNSLCNYEQNKKGLFAYFSNRNCLHLLCDVPKILKDQEILKGDFSGNKSKGTYATTEVNKYARSLIKTWLLKPANGEDEGSETLNLHKIRAVALLKEMIYWNPDGNFDRISSLGMVMILREDRISFLKKEGEGSKKAVSAASHPFWTRAINANMRRF